MAPRATRLKAATVVAPNEVPTPQISRVENEPHKLFILPREASDTARMVSLPNPATSGLCRYFYCPKLGLYEFTKVTSPRTTPRSCLISMDLETQAEDEINPSSQAIQNGYILQDADFFIATPLDPLFFITPLLQASAGMFQPADDYLEQLSGQSNHLEQLLRDRHFRNILSNRLKAVSEVQDIGGGQEVCKPQLHLLADVLIDKAIRATGQAWPASMEEGLVRKEVEIPVTSKQGDEDQLTEISTTGEHVPLAAITGSTQTCSTPTNVLVLMRQRLTLKYMLSAYISPSMVAPLESQISRSSRLDFKPLSEHLERVKNAKAEVQALRVLSDNISRKRSALEDDEAAEARAEKKRKKDEEEIKKKLESRAIKQLKKVDTTGMQKLSSFFTKPAPQTRSQKTSS